MTDPSPALVEVVGLEKHFPVRARSLFGRAGRVVHAIDGVSFSLGEGETLGVIGETGCGKTTVLRCVAGLLEPTHGSIRLGDREMTAADARSRRLARLRQVVFQDPFSAFNPRRTVGTAIISGLRLHGLHRGNEAEYVHELLQTVGLEKDHTHRFPREFSGGQLQRVGIARALSLEPRLIALDEPISAQDPSVKAQIINLLKDLQESRGLSYLFVSHDLSVVRCVSHRVAVMFAGKFVEVCPVQAVTTPLHPYTHALMDAIPIPDLRHRRRRKRTPGVLGPGDQDDTTGCRFRSRCPSAQEICVTEEPLLEEIDSEHAVACHLPLTEQ